MLLGTDDPGTTYVTPCLPSPAAPLADRYSQIEHENRILLSKMSEMMKHSTMDLHAKSYRYGHSLNRDRRRHELQRITQDNQKILRRIQYAMPQYNHWEWEEDRKKQEQLLRRIGEYEPPLLEKSTTRSRRGILASTGASAMAGPAGYPGVDMGMDSAAGAYPGSAGMPGGGTSLASSFAGMSLGK